MPYNLSIRFSSNEKLHSAHITCNISWCILSTERELKLSPSAGLTIPAEKQPNTIMQRLPRELDRRRPDLNIHRAFFAPRTAATERRAYTQPASQFLSPQQPASRVTVGLPPPVGCGGPGVRRRSAANRLPAIVPTPCPTTVCAAPWCGKRLSLCNSSQCRPCAEWFCVLHSKQHNHTCRRKPLVSTPTPSWSPPAWTTQPCPHPSYPPPPVYPPGAAPPTPPLPHTPSPCSTPNPMRTCSPRQTPPPLPPLPTPPPSLPEGTVTATATKRTRRTSLKLPTFDQRASCSVPRCKCAEEDAQSGRGRPFRHVGEEPVRMEKDM